MGGLNKSETQPSATSTKPWPPAGVRPYYCDDAVCILLGDCREIVPTLGRFDLLLTDPPYGVEGGRGGQLKDYRKADYCGDWTDNGDYIASVCVPIIEWGIANCLTTVVTPGTRHCFLYPHPIEIGCFFHPAAVRIGLFGFQSCTPILYYGWYKNRGKGALATGISVCETAEKNGHPCPKPLAAWKWLLNRSCVEGAHILDPFAGSGTTGRAAKDLGRKAVLIELEERYCEIAAKRMAQEILPLTLE